MGNLQKFICGLSIAFLLNTSSTIAQDAPFSTESPFHNFFQESVADTFDAEDHSKNNFIRIINRGDYSLQLRIHLIRSAVTSLDIQTFIWSDDECGTLVFNEILNAARRGVKVRLLIDHIASLKDPGTIGYLTTASPNIEIKYYRPHARLLKPSIPVYTVSALLFAGGMNQRMHNKIFIVDGVLAMTGGRNYDNHYYNMSTSYNFKDRDIMVLGPTVKDAQISFDRYWEYRHSISSKDLPDVVRRLRTNDIQDESFFSSVSEYGMFNELHEALADPELMKTRFVDTLQRAESTRFLTDDPGKNNAFWLFKMWGSSKVTKDLKNVIMQTQEELVMQSPYLVLNRWSRRPFKKIRKKSPDVKFIVSTNSFAATDNILAYSANYRLRSPYIRKLKFQIYEFMPRPEIMQEEFPQYADMKSLAAAQGLEKPFFPVHGKAFVLDKKIAFVGTYNLDSRSFNLNTEEGFLIEDETIAMQLRADILRDIAPENSWVIAKKNTPSEELAELNRSIEWFSRMLPIDLWPIRYSSSFQLKEGEKPVPQDHPEFYNRYQDIGSFPGADGLSSPEILTQFYKIFGKFATPAL